MNDIYAYFDYQGTLKERVSAPIRANSTQVNSIYAYWDNQSVEPVTYSVTWRLVGSDSLETTSEHYAETLAIPANYLGRRDLVFFKEAKLYNFIRFPVPSAVTAVAGTYVATIRYALSTQATFVLGSLTFEVEGERGIVLGESLTLDQYNYLLEQYSEVYDRFLPLTGGTITGDLAVTLTIRAGGNLAAKGYWLSSPEQNIIKLDNTVGDLGELQFGIPSGDYSPTFYGSLGVKMWDGREKVYPTIRFNYFDENDEYESTTEEQIATQQWSDARYVPTSRTIAGLSLESDITENALFDKMSIKGRYATLTALQTADPNHGYCYLVEENNHWYYWNGAAWTDGGKYMSALQDENVLTIESKGVEFGYYANNSKVKVASSTHKCLVYTPKAKDLTLKYTITLVQNITSVNVEFLDGTVRALPYSIAETLTFSFTNVKALYVNFWLNTPDFEVEIYYNDALSQESLPASNLPIFAIGKTYNLTIKNATDAGYYAYNNGAITFRAAYPSQRHQCAKIAMNGKKCYISFNMGSTSTNLPCVIIEYNDGTTAEILGNADVANYNIENAKYLYLNFFRGSTAGTFPETYTITDATDEVQGYDDYTDNQYEWTGKKAVCAGDSISTGLDGGTAWSIKFADVVGCNMSNLAISGAFYTPGLYHSSQVDDLKTQLTNYSGDKTLVDYVFLAGGTNDFWWSADLEDFADAVGDCIDYALTNYPNAKIIVITPIQFNGVSGNTENIQTYRNIITEVAMQKDTTGRITIVQGYKFNFGKVRGDAYTLAMQYDGVHPSQLGLKTAYLKGLLKVLYK